MILDRASDLKQLSGLASSSAHTSNEDAALASIEETVTGASELFSDLGVAKHEVLSRLAPDQRVDVGRAAEQLRQALTNLADASDTELVAYASAGANERGSLVAVPRQAASLRRALLAAQQSLLSHLANEIWPEEEALHLDVISHLPVGGGAGRLAQEAHERLVESAASDRGLSSAELDSLLRQGSEAVDAARPLRDAQVSAEVLEFWEAAQTEAGAELAALTPSLIEWLEVHDALASFTVHRRR